MRRFTLAPDRIAGGRVTFDREESRHIARVLRLRSGDTVLATDGTGHDYTVRLEAVGEAVTGTVLGVAPRPAESPLRLTLVQSVPKGDKMEAIVRAATELGVARIVPVLSERTIVALDPARWRERTRRWQRVAKEAAKQCGRAVIPPVETPRSLVDFLGADEPAHLRLCLWEGAAPPLPCARGSPRRAGGGAHTCRGRGGARPGLDGDRRGTAHPPRRDRRSGAARDPAIEARRHGLSAPRASSAGWEHFQVENDVGVRAWGPTRAEAFGQAALGVLALTIAPADVEARESREVRAQGEDAETLLVAWINECLYVHEIEGFAVRRVEILSAGARVVNGLLHGEPLDTRHHRPSTVVRAATRSRASVEERESHHEVSVIMGA